MKKLGLLPKLIVGILGGIVIGLLGASDLGFLSAAFYALVRLLTTFSGLFGNFLGYIIPLIIIGFIVPGIADLGGKAGKLLGVTVVFAYLSTVFAGVWGWIGATALIPFLVGAEGVVVENREVYPLFELAIPPIMNVMTALVTAFILGLGIAAIKGKTLLNVAQEFQEIIIKVIEKVFLPFLPFHIAGIFAQMAFGGEIASTIGVYGWVFLLTISLDYFYILFQYIIAFFMTGKAPINSVKKMLPAYMTAIGTQSSAATIPVSLKCIKSIDGVDEEVAEFVAPLGAATHLSGSTITIISCAIAVLALDGISLGFGEIFSFIMMLGITMVAAPGVPGGAVMAALGLLETMLGFTEAQLGVMIAIYIAQDSFGTAANVVGDGALALIVNKFAKKDKNK